MKPEPIDDLREVLVTTEMGLTAPHIAPFLITGLRHYFAAGEAGQPISLEMAFGIAKPGRHRWWTKEPKLRRNELLCELRRCRFAHLTEPWDAARAIYELLHRQPVAPEDDTLLRTVMALGGGMIQVRQIKRALA